MTMTCCNEYKAMPNNHNSVTHPGQPMIYEVRLQGHLDRQWTDWFGGWTITLEDDGNTLLTGPVVDQAALHGLLRQVRDLGLTLLSVNRVDLGKAETLDTN